MLKAVEAPLAGHPDKVCDLIVESVVDEYLRRDPMSHMDVQALGSNGMVMIGGVIESKADFDVVEVARRAYESLGYADQVEMFVNLERPGLQPRRPVGKTGTSGSAIVHGYATKETREMLPRPVVYANALAERIDDLRRTDRNFAWLKPDGKVQIMMEGEKITAATIIVAHDDSMETAQVQSLLLKQVIEPVLGTLDGVKVFLNPAGSFTTGGFQLNAGVSGRKVLADTYGGLLPHGGASFVGKDPLKPSRAAAYMARYAARELVKEGLGKNVFVTAIYSVGVDEPIALSARTGDGQDISATLVKRFDFRPEAIVERFNLRRPIYSSLVNYGTFGRPGVPWEE